MNDAAAKGARIDAAAGYLVATAAVAVAVAVACNAAVANAVGLL